MHNKKHRFSMIFLLSLLLPALPALAGSLNPPNKARDASGSPVGSMRTLDELQPIWSQNLPDAQRFEIVLDGAGVLDGETGLVWERSPATAVSLWVGAQKNCYSKSVGARYGWRLPEVEELASLVSFHTDSSEFGLPSDNPFIGIPRDAEFWTATPDPESAGKAYSITLLSKADAPLPGEELKDLKIKKPQKATLLHVWCVRGAR